MTTTIQNYGFVSYRTDATNPANKGDWVAVAVYRDGQVAGFERGIVQDCDYLDNGDSIDAEPSYLVEFDIGSENYEGFEASDILAISRNPPTM